MTEQEAKEISMEDAAKLPWHYPCVVFLRDRYYLCIANLELPPQMKRGDILATLWRYKKEPTIWRLIYRFRWYSKVESGPFDGKDNKSWYAVTIDGTGLTEDQVMARALTPFRMMEVEARRYDPNMRLDILEIRGDDRRAMGAIQANKPPWMHIKAVETGKKK